MKQAERSVVSAAITHVITRLAAMSPFLNKKRIQAVVDCMNYICPPHVAKHLSEVRLKHLMETEAMQSGIRAAAGEKRLKG